MPVLPKKLMKRDKVIWYGAGACLGGKDAPLGLSYQSTKSLTLKVNFLSVNEKENATFITVQHNLFDASFTEVEESLTFWNILLN